MNEQNVDETIVANVPEVAVHSKRTFSIVWLVPVIAAIIGGWLAYKAISERGPTITIVFKSAEGLEAGKSKIKYKDVDIGQVEKIGLSKDLSGVVITAVLVKQAEEYLTENTRFWIVRARIGATGASGLRTIFSGAYISIDPVRGGTPTRNFEGLEHPPVVTRDLPGSHFLLQADRLSSLDIGSPVYFRQIKVGQVVAYNIDEKGNRVMINVFIRAPYHHFVRKNTRFWNAGGLDISVDASGIKVDTESLVTLIIGGIAFETPVNLEPGDAADDSDIFVLYRNHESIYEKTYMKKSYWVLYFDGSVNGLSVGAPVDFRGIKVGRVADIQLEFLMEKSAVRIPVLIELEPERIAVTDEHLENVDDPQFMDLLVSKGLRAQLKRGNLLTGQLFVELNFHPDAPVRNIVWEGKYPVLPTIASPLEEITTGVAQLITRLEKFPLEQIGKSVRNTFQNAEHLMASPELEESIQSLNHSLKQINAFSSYLNEDMIPAVTTTLEKTQKTLTEAENILRSDSQLRHRLNHALTELADAARSVRLLVDYLEQHPEALIKGKDRANEK
jgi:paraquat-inducible protein B